MKNKIREYIQNKLGYWFYKSKHLPVGTDLFIDLESKVEYPLEVIFDTEGYEEQVLSGATESIKSGKIKIIYLEVGFSKLNLGNTNFLKLYETLENLNYTFFGLYEISQIGISSNLHYGNALFIHNSISSQIKNWQLK